MNKFDKHILWILILLATVFVASNVIFMSIDLSKNREYNVEANRIVKELETKSINDIEMSEYPNIISIYKMTESNMDTFYTNTDYDYIIRIVGENIYRINYSNEGKQSVDKYLILINSSLAVFVLIILIILFCLRNAILKPFSVMVDLPYNLAKGNLSTPIAENKNKMFGKFLWGLDLLREDLEQKKQAELDLQKEKKTLILSISHDINTPLSAIKLYAQALEKNLYDTKEKQIEIAQSINKKTIEIGNFVSEIIKASNEEFLKLEVKNDAFYLKDLLNEISNYYNEKLDLLKIPLTISDYSNCLMHGDINRSVEVIQNVFENAIKYGDGNYIDIDLSKEEDCMMITIKNSGCTLSENEISCIFDSFWRGSNVGTINGSGLGLYICKELMKKMNGEIFATKSMNENSGENELKVSIIFQMI